MNCNCHRLLPFYLILLNLLAATGVVLYIVNYLYNPETKQYFDFYEENYFGELFLSRDKLTVVFICGVVLFCLFISLVCFCSCLCTCNNSARKRQITNKNLTFSSVKRKLAFLKRRKNKIHNEQGKKNSKKESKKKKKTFKDTVWSVESELNNKKNKTFNKNLRDMIKQTNALSKTVAVDPSLTNTAINGKTKNGTFKQRMAATTTLSNGKNENDLNQAIKTSTNGEIQRIVTISEHADLDRIITTANGELRQLSPPPTHNHDTS